MRLTAAWWLLSGERDQQYHTVRKLAGRSGAVRLALAAILAIGLVAGCSSPVTSLDEGNTGANGGANSGQCEIYDSGYDARIVVTQGGQSECQTLAQSLSADGDFWTFTPQDTSDQLSMVCVMDNSGDQAEVIDGGGQLIGHSVCSGMLSSGWTEDTAAEGQIQQQEAQAQASQSAAAATQSAAQAQAQQVQQDQQTAAADTQSLQGDPGTLLGDVQTMAGDVSTAQTDLGTLQSDASQVDGQCDNVSGVADDANGLADDMNGLGDDVNSTGNDIGNVRADISKVQSDEQTLTNDGVALPASMGQAVKAAQAAIATAISKANADIAAVNGYVDQGFSTANGLATGSCAGYGPGAPPSPPADLS